MGHHIYYIFNESYLSWLKLVKSKSTAVGWSTKYASQRFPLLYFPSVLVRFPWFKTRKQNEVTGTWLTLYLLQGPGVARTIVDKREDSLTGNLAFRVNWHLKATAPTFCKKMCRMNENKNHRAATHWHTHCWDQLKPPTILTVSTNHSTWHLTVKMDVQLTQVSLRLKEDPRAGVAATSTGQSCLLSLKFRWASRGETTRMKQRHPWPPLLWYPSKYLLPSFRDINFCRNVLAYSY